jgi:membrane protease subunit HflK
MANRPEWIGPKGGDLRIKVDPRLIVIAVAGIIAVLWFVFGGPVYTVAPEEQGVVLTFGKYTKTTPPGLHFKMPWPVQTVDTPKVTQVKRLEIGFRSIERGGQNYYQSFTDSPELLHEAQVLTGDENVVNCSMSVQYRITTAKDYLFNFVSEADADSALRKIAEAALRQAIGDRPIDHALTTRKDLIQNEVQLKMQELADLYGVGVRVVTVQLQDVKPPKEVEQSFREVASAREKREELVNKARGYQSERIPRAKGEAQRVLLEAAGYKESRMADARGQAVRFTALAKEYTAAPEITRARMYFEAMEGLLPRVKLTVIDEHAGVLNLRNLGVPVPGAGGTDVLPNATEGGRR